MPILIILNNIIIYAFKINSELFSMRIKELKPLRRDSTMALLPWALKKWEFIQKRNIKQNRNLKCEFFDNFWKSLNASLPRPWHTEIFAGVRRTCAIWSCILRTGWRGSVLFAVCLLWNVIRRGLFKYVYTRMATRDSEFNTHKLESDIVMPQF